MLPYDFDCMKIDKSLEVHPKSSFWPYRAQYPLSVEAEQGLDDIVTSLIERGAIVPCEASPVNNPLLVIRKTNLSWHLMQDLRGVNSTVYLCTPISPNPPNILSNMPPNFSSSRIWQMHFSVSLCTKTASTGLHLHLRANVTSAALCPRDSVNPQDSLLKSCRET